MRWPGRWAMGAAFVASIGAHSGGMGYWHSQPTQVEVEAGEGAAQARIGASFADMAVGTLTPVTAEEAPQTPTEPIEVTTAKLPDRTQPVPPDQLTPAQVTSQPTPRVPLTEAVTDIAITNIIQPTTQALLPLMAIEPQKQSQPEETREAPAKSLRPKPRDPFKVPEQMLRPSEPQPVKRAEQKPKKQKPKTQPKKATPAPQGNAAKNNTQGSTTGTNQAKAKKQGVKNGNKNAGAGNAKASNYPGLVMRKIARQRKPRVNAKGTASVRFRVSGSGGLASVSLARSSGSAKLDAAALNHIRRAAPFPPPPPGAQRSFSIQISGR